MPLGSLSNLQAQFDMPSLPILLQIQGVQVLGSLCFHSCQSYAHILLVIDPALQHCCLEKIPISLVATKHQSHDDTLIIGAYASSDLLVSCFIFCLYWQPNDVRPTLVNMLLLAEPPFVVYAPPHSSGWWYRSTRFFGSVSVQFRHTPS